MINTDLSYLYGAVWGLSSAMIVMLMASSFASEPVERKQMQALRASTSMIV